MPREVVMQLWCDPCDAAGEKVAAVASWTAGAVKAEVQPSLHAIDVCEVHNKQMEDYAAAINAAPPFVRPAGAAKAPPAAPGRPVKPQGEYVCPVCDTGFSSASSRINHVWNVHRPGDERTLTAGVCPDCGTVVDTAQGMAAHRRLGHGFDALHDALLGVKGFKMKAAKGA